MQKSPLEKKATFYEDEYKKLLKLYQSLLREKPLGSCVCIPKELVLADIDEIIEISYKDSFGVNKTIVPHDSQNLNFLAYKNMQIKEFNCE